MTAAGPSVTSQPIHGGGWRTHKHATIRTAYFTCSPIASQRCIDLHLWNAVVDVQCRPQRVVIFVQRVAINGYA